MGSGASSNRSVQKAKDSNLGQLLAEKVARADEVATQIQELTDAVATDAVAKARDAVAVSQVNMDELFLRVQEGAAMFSQDMKTKLNSQVQVALANHDDDRINFLLDSAIAASIVDGANPCIRQAADGMAEKQLQEAIAAGEPKRLKGALVAAKRLNATHVPSFGLAVERYREVRKLPQGWDVQQMVLDREGNKMVSKLKVSSPEGKEVFQKLLDLTCRKVYTRDRRGDNVPDRLELVRVTAVTNDDLWADYMVRRENLRRELEADPADFEEYQVDTATGSEGCGAGGEGAQMQEIVTDLATDFGEPLLACVNEVFLFHGTNTFAANKITTGNFKINLAGSNAGTLYGRGIYLAENATKSDEYTQPLPSGERHMLVCRAMLGRVYYTDEKKTDPRTCEDACLRGRFNSVLGDRKKCRGTFREFIIFDEEQVYANYILSYRRVNAPAAPAAAASAAAAS